jgi:NADH:ubiquinone oxidoreductase subunit 5 (subunit L)/multisubunit Na+/H+ antiporter MnhA subunit
VLAIVFPFRRLGQPAAWFSILCAAGALASAVLAWQAHWRHRNAPALELAADAGQSLAHVGVVADSDSTVMLILVSLVSLFVQVYSLGYLQRRAAPSFGRITPTSRSSRSR